MFKNILTLVIFFFCIGILNGATHYVPDDYPTIQSAIDASVDYDIVIVMPGTYYENIDFIGKAITVKSNSGC